MAYKKTDWLDDQVLVTGFAAGGLTEVPQEQFRTCSMAVTLPTAGLATQLSRLLAVRQRVFWTAC